MGNSYLVINGHRPDHDSLSVALGFPVPEPFVRFVQSIYDQAAGDGDRTLEIFDEATRLFPGGPEVRYESTPCELHPIGSTGVDGDHYGYLIHAPESPAKDYPLCHYCPMDSDGVILIGSDTRQGLAELISGGRVWQGSVCYPPGSPELHAVAAAMGIKLSGRNRDTEPSIHVPTDWTLLSSMDGVGVLAPTPLFNPGPLTEINRFGPAEAFLAAANGEIRSGYLATALYYLRNGFWACWTDHPIALGEQMCEVYEKLGRPSLAQVMEAKIGTWQTTSDG